MRVEIETIIKNLLSSDNESIKKATADLTEAFKNPDIIPVLCDIVATSPEKQIRQYAVVLLSKRLGKLRNWNMVPPDQQIIIKQGILRTLISEQEKSVRNSIAQFVGVLVRHEAEKPGTWMNELLEFIITQCSSSDPKENELGSNIFATLADSAPDQFVTHMEAICNMLTQALIVAETNGNLASPVISYILSGMAYLAPFVMEKTRAEKSMIKAVPLILKAVHAFAYNPDADMFARAFELMDCLVEFSPKLLQNDFKSILEFTLEVAQNKNLNPVVRVQTLAFLSRLVRLRKKVIIKNKLVLPILMSLFSVMSEETDNNSDKYSFFGDEDNNTPITGATQVLDLMALKMAPEKLIPPLLTILEPALQGQDVNDRRAAFLCMAVIAEGCSEAICNKYLPTMLNIIKEGITDNSPMVRNAAFFALGQFSEHLQPDISAYAAQILPVLFDFLHQMTINAKQGLPDPQHIDRMFYALETFIENLEDEIIQYLPVLMERISEALQPCNSYHMRELALCTAGAVATTAKRHLLPYFEQLINLLQPYLITTNDSNLNNLRIQAVDSLAGIASSIGKENFMPLVNDTMNFCLVILDENGFDDPDLRRAIFNLLGSLASVLNENMESVLPKLIDRITQTILSTEEILPEFKENDLPSPVIEFEDQDIDIEETDDEDDNDFVGYNVESDYLDEKEEAITCLKDFATHTGTAFQPYLQMSFETVYKMVDHGHSIIRKASVEALGAFVIALSKYGNHSGTKKACEILVPKFLHIVSVDDEISVVIITIDTLNEIFREVKKIAVPNQEIADNVFDAISNVLLKKVVCQFEEPSENGEGDIDDKEFEDSEYEETLIESAGNLIPQFGHAVGPNRFALFFGRIYPLFLQKLKKANRDEGESRDFIYGVLAECFCPLDKYVANFYDVFFNIMINGMNDTELKTRQNAAFGLGELVLYAGEKSYSSYPIVLQALSSAISTEKERVVIDNLCGAIARIILNNHSLVPLADVLNVLFSNLPLQVDTDEHETIFKCIKNLLINVRYSLIPHLEHILSVVIHVLYRKEFPNQDTFETGVLIIKEIHNNHNEDFMKVASKNPEVYNFVQTM